MKKLKLLLSLFSVAALVPSVYGQGFYTTWQIDGGPYIQTDAVGYPGSGQCPSMSLWNEFNGDYVSGWAPADLTSGTYTYEGSFPWNYGYSYQYFSPYGYCVAASISWQDIIDEGSTTSRDGQPGPPPHVSNGNGACPQITDSLSCSNTSTPKFPVSTVVIGTTYGIVCSSYYNVLVASLFGTIQAGPAITVYGPGYCTPK